MDITLTPVGLRKLWSRRKKHDQVEADQETTTTVFLTNFSNILKNDPPIELPFSGPSQTKLFRTTTARAKAMVRICPVKVAFGDSMLSCDALKRQITVCGDPSLVSCQDSTTSLKNFSFDAVFPEDSSLAEVCATSLTDLLQSVVLGSNGCIYCYGHAGLGKTYTMLGIDDSRENLGVIPSAISWIYNLITERVKKTASKFSVRVSAIEVTGKQAIVRDLLTNISAEKESAESAGSTVFFHEDPIGGVRIENQKELRAPTAQHAAFYLDAAIAARTVPDADEDSSNSHFRFTLHIYQYRIGRISRSHNKVIGGRSQLHFLDLSNCSSSSSSSGGSSQRDSYSISTLGTVLFATLSGQRHVPQKESRLTQLIRESMSGPSCHTCMIAHVSPSTQSHSETLQVLQLASKIHRLKPKKKSKLSSASSDDSSHEDYLTSEKMHSSFYTRSTEGRSSSDPEYISSSEQSCDTVIFVGKGRPTNGDRKPTGGNTPATRRTILKVPEDLKFSDDQRKLFESSVTVQGSSDSIVKSFKSKNEVAEIGERLKFGSEASLKKDNEVSSGSTSSDLSQLSVFELEPFRGVATQLESSQKNVDVRHDPLGDECHQNFEESAVGNSQTYHKSALGISSGSEQVRCRVRKRHHPLLISLVKENELWVDGPNAVVNVQAFNKDKSTSDGVKEVLMDSIKPVFINSVQLAKKSSALLSKDEKADSRAKNATAAVGCTKEAAVADKYNAEQSTGLAATCSGEITARQAEGTKQQVEEEVEVVGNDLVLQSVGLTTHTKVGGSSDEAAKRTKGVQQTPEILAIANHPGCRSETPPASQRPDSVNTGYQEKNTSALMKNHLLRALSKLSATEANPVENTHPSSPREGETHGLLEQPTHDADSGDRTAQWVKNIQDASASRFVQLLHSRKELLRSFRVRRNSHSMSKAPTMDFINNCQILATFDQPADVEPLNSKDNSTSNSVSDSSTAGDKSVLDINENRARLQESNHEDFHSQCSGIKSVAAMQTSHLERPNGCSKAGIGCSKAGIGCSKAGIGCSKAGIDCSKAGIGCSKAGIGCSKAGIGCSKAGIGCSKVGIGCGREKSNRSTSDKRALTDCLRGTLLFCGRASTALDRDDAPHYIDEIAEDAHRFDTSRVVRLSQPDGASNPNIMDELHEHLVNRESNTLQSKSSVHRSAIDQRKSSSNPLLLQEKTGQAFQLDRKDTNNEEQSIFSTFHSSTPLIDSKAAFSLNLSARQRSESVDCNMTENALSDFVLSYPRLSQHNSTMHVKSSLQLTNCDDAENLCLASSDDDVVACSPRTVSACSCHFDIGTNSVHQSGKISDKKSPSLPCCYEVPAGLLALTGTESRTGARNERRMERNGSDDSNFTLHLFRSLECHDQRSGFDVARITEIPNQEKMIAERNEDEDVTWLPKTCEKMTLDKRQQRVKVLLNSQDKLKEELAAAKDVLMIDRSCWGDDLVHVEEQMDCNDSNYLEVLERETSSLQKRVNACKSRIMVVTVFDITS